MSWAWKNPRSRSKQDFVQMENGRFVSDLAWKVLENEHVRRRVVVAVANIKRKQTLRSLSAEEKATRKPSASAARTIQTTRRQMP